MNGTAAELAESDALAVFPFIGWWRERPKENKFTQKSRYDLLVSIESPETEIEICTPIQTQLQIPIGVET